MADLLIPPNKVVTLPSNRNTAADNPNTTINIRLPTTTNNNTLRHQTRNPTSPRHTASLARARPAQKAHLRCKSQAPKATVDSAISRWAPHPAPSSDTRPDTTACWAR